MKRAVVVVFAALSLLSGGLVAAAPAGAAPPVSDPERRVDVYTATIAPGQLGEIVALGNDRHDLKLSGVPAASGSQVGVEVILSTDQAEQLRRNGIDLQLKEVGAGTSVAQRATGQATAGFEVWQTYAGRGGLKEEVEQAAAAHPGIAQLVTVGRSVNGTDIVALRVTRDAARVAEGHRPATLYMSAQHAREWITPEMTTRLMQHVLAGYGSDPAITDVVNRTELWFLPVANPDGYDFTFEPGQRLWRKNLRDNDGDGVIAPGDGVDLNRNFPTRWGYDNEGSSPNPGSETYRGPSPASEPETQALDALMARVRFEFMLNYHSAAGLLLYGVGWQVATPAPDDVIYEAMAGDDANPAVPGYDPDISAELYTTNGDTDTHAQEAHGTLGFTPEMATCETASQAVPDDEWVDTDCGSGFEFPDDEALVQAEFERNIPFALSVGQSALDPDDPVSVVGRTAEDFRVDAFDVSYGQEQTVAVWAKRALEHVRLNYRVDGGRRVHREKVEEWTGGERYGGENDDYYAEFRAEVDRADVGSTVEVWFTGVERRRHGRDDSAGAETEAATGGGHHSRRVESEHFTYTVAQDTGAEVLVVANEDYTGVNPDYPDSVVAPRYAALHQSAVEAAGYDADVWDVDAQGVPHDLGVLSHYDAVLWYLGENRISMDPEDELTDSPLGPLPDVSVKESQQYLTIAVRDYLNEGGKLVHAGETAQLQGLPGISDAVGGLYYGLNGDPTAQCVIAPRPDGSLGGFFEDCLIMADDFRQYWLGAFSHSTTSAPIAAVGVAPPLTGLEVELGGPVVAGDNPLDEAGTYLPTSDVLPGQEFPQFASQGVAQYVSDQNLYQPIEGEWYVGVPHQDDSYTRLTRTVDLAAVVAAANPRLAFQLSVDMETGYDNLVVEARSAGQEDWTTLPELGQGLSTTTPPTECEAGFLIAEHPWLTHYLGGPDCTAPGSSGTWNALTGSTGGWTSVAYDLSAFAGQQVEVSLSYVTDSASGGVGVFVDDTSVVVGGTPTEQEGFETGLGAWSVTGPPEGSPPAAGVWERSQDLVIAYAGTTTDDTLLLGFGLEQVAGEAQRLTVVRAALEVLLADEPDED